MCRLYRDQTWNYSSRISAGFYKHRAVGVWVELCESDAACKTRGVLRCEMPLTLRDAAAETVLNLVKLKFIQKGLKMHHVIDAARGTTNGVY